MPDNLPEDNFVFFYSPDHLGSTEYVTDAAGELYEHVQYFPFGETWVSEHKNTETLPYLFTGKELDEETGLYYFGARYYDPRTSVWQSADPIFDGDLGKPIGLAAFTYAHNNPLRLTDPTGLSALTGTWTAEDEPGPGAQVNEESAGLGMHIRGPGGTAPPLGLGAPPAWGNVGLLAEREFKVEDTSETWKTGFEIATFFAPGPGEGLMAEKVAAKAASAGRLARAWNYFKGFFVKEAESGAPKLLGPAMNVADHHVIPAFRGQSARYAQFIKARGIDVDQFTVTVSHGAASHHLKFIHGKGGWNRKWMEWIDANPNATAKDIYQFAGRMMDEYGLSGLHIHPHGK